MGVEIERVFLLRALPEPMPSGEVWEIEQGYLAPAAEDLGAAGGARTADSAPMDGRIRRVRHADGRVEYFHTMKRGMGLVREETERSIDRADFDAAWPRTLGRRIQKVRTRIREGDRTWELDRFLNLPVLLAECELPAADTPLEIPLWLAPCIEREVTQEPAFRNSEMARRAGFFERAP